MIVLNLTCAEGHIFEGWFPSSDAFDQQCVQSLVTCAVCASTTVSRLPSSPRINRHVSHTATIDIPENSPAAAMATAIKAVAEMIVSSENVDDRFPEEARKIHYGEAEPRNIRGKATLEETKELLDEGIPILPIPIPPKDETH